MQTISKKTESFPNPWTLRLRNRKQTIPYCSPFSLSQETEREQNKLDKEKLREPNQRHSEKKATFSSENGQNWILVQSWEKVLCFSCFFFKKIYFLFCNGTKTENRGKSNPDENSFVWEWFQSFCIIFILFSMVYNCENMGDHVLWSTCTRGPQNNNWNEIIYIKIYFVKFTPQSPIGMGSCLECLFWRIFSIECINICWVRY